MPAIPVNAVSMLLCTPYYARIMLRCAIRKRDLKHYVPSNGAQVRVRISCSEVEHATLAKGTTTNTALPPTNLK